MGNARIEDSDLGPDGVDRRAVSADPALGTGGLMACGPGDDPDPKMTGWGITICHDASEEIEALMRGVSPHNIHRR